MADCLMFCALAFLAGGGAGGLLANELAWRKQRRELASLGDRINEDALRWQADLDGPRAYREQE
jgi:hypothetical protein